MGAMTVGVEIGGGCYLAFAKPDPAGAYWMEVPMVLMALMLPAWMWIETRGSENDERR